MTKRTWIIVSLLAVNLAMAEGQGIIQFLRQVDENNPGIIAYRSLLEVRKAEATTGLTPPGPAASYGYMPGRTEEMGIKKTWTVTQAFAFPTKYILQNRISRTNVALAEQEFNLGRLNTLLKAKLLLLELIRDGRRVRILDNRKETYSLLKSGWEKLLDSGETTILEYNKILLKLSSINLAINRLHADIAAVKEKLDYMSGNSVELPPDEEFPSVEEPDFDQLLTEKSNSHPAFILPEMEYQASLQKLKLSKAGNLPEFHAGMASEIIPGENYTGPVAGITIPLWANSNNVKLARSAAEYSFAQRDAVLLELKTTVRTEYENMTALGKSMGELVELIDSGNNKEYLEKALSAGEISLTDYFIYLEALFEAEDSLLELEYEYNRSLAVLYDHELLN